MGHGLSAPVEGSWPFAPVVEALADLCRRHPTLLDGLSDQHRTEIDRALAGEEITLVEEFGDVVVVEGVDHRAALTPADDLVFI